MAGFDAVHEQVDKDLDSSSSQSETTESGDINSQDATDNHEMAQAIADLEKLEKFRFDGQELTPQELKSMVMRQKDYTQKTMSLAEERKAFEQQRSESQKYYDNLHYDLENVRKNPALAQEFLRVYPESFHRYLRQTLESNSTGQAQTTGTPQTPQIPFELMSQVQRLESFVHQQEVAKAEVDIEQNLSKALKDFPRASKKEVLADIFEFHNQLQPDPITGRKPGIPFDVWRRVAESSHNEREDGFKAYQKELIQKQSQANAKASDVGSGGGIAGQAPKKFKNMKELNQHVLGQFTGSKQ